MQKSGKFLIPVILITVAVMVVAIAPLLAVAAETPGDSIIHWDKKPVLLTVLPFHNRGGSEWDWLSVGFADSLFTDCLYLSAAKTMPLVYVETTQALHEACPDMDLGCAVQLKSGDWKRLSSAIDLDTFILGEYLVRDDNVSIKMSVMHKKDWSSQKNIQFECALKDVQKTISTKLIDLLASYGLPMHPKEKSRILSTKTKSLQAWKFNSLGFWEQVRHKQLPESRRQGHLAVWKEYMEKAVSIDPDYAEAWNNLGWLYVSANDYESALNAFQNALKIKSDLIDSVHGIGNALEKTGKPQEAASCYKKAVFLNPAITWHIETPYQFFSDTGQQTIGLEILDTVIPIYKKYEDWKHVAGFLSWKGTYLYQLNELKKAKAAFEENMIVNKKIYPLDHDYTIVSMENVAGLARQLSDYKTAYETYQELLSVYKSKFGAESEKVALTLNSLALLSFNLNQYERSLDEFTRELNVYTAVHGADDDHVGTILQSIGRVNQELQRWPDAASAYQRALDHRVKNLGPDHEKLIEPLRGLSDASIKMKDYAKALEYLHQLLPLQQKYKGKYSADVLLTQTAMADCHEAENRIPKAAETLESMMPGMDQEFGPNHLATLRLHLRLAGLYKTMGMNDKALKEYRTIVSMYDSGQVIDEFGPTNDLETLEESLLYQAMIHVENKDFKRAQPLLEKYMALQEKSGSPDSIKTGQAMLFLGSIFQQKGDYPKAVELYQKALKIADGPETPGPLYIPTVLAGLTKSYMELGRYKEALPYSKRVVEVNKKTLGLESPETVDSIQQLAIIQDNLGQYKDALANQKQVYEIYVRLHGEDHLITAQAGIRLARLHDRTGDFNQAQTLFEKHIPALEAKAEHPEDLVVALTEFGNNSKLRKDYHQAEAAYKKAASMAEKALGTDHPRYLAARAGLASILVATNRKDEAESIFLEVLAAHEKQKGPDHQETLSIRAVYAEFLYSNGKRKAAEDQYRLILERLEKTKGPDHPILSSTLLNLAMVVADRGDLAQADELYKRALAIVKKSKGPESLEYASVLNNMAEFYRNIGRKDEIKALHQQALAIREKILGPDHPDVALSLNNLAGLYRQDDPEKAAELYLRAMEIYKKTYGMDHPIVAQTVNNVGVLYLGQANYTQAEFMFKLALDIRENNLGKNHPDTAASYMSLAAFYYLTGKYKESEEYNRKGIASLEAIAGPGHPNLAVYLYPLAFTLAQSEKYSEAAEIYLRAFSIDEVLLDNLIGFTSEKQKMAVLTQKKWALDSFLGMVGEHMADDANARRSALDLWLRRKGMILEAQRRFQEAMLYHETDEARAVFQELARVRAEISQLYFISAQAMPPEIKQQKLADLEKKKQELEARLGRASRNYAVYQKTARADSKALSAALPKGTVLIEFARVAAFNFQYRKNKQDVMRDIYLAFVIHAGDNHISMKVLGEADFIDAEISKLKKAVIDLEDVRGETALQAGRKVYDLVFQPLVESLGSTREIFISPDGNLSLIPFEILRLPDGRFLIEDFQFNYLSAGRDILSWNDQKGSPGKPVLIGAPAYDMNSEEKIAQMQRLADERGIKIKPDHTVLRNYPDDMRGLSFSPLPGTAEEVEEISRILGTENAEVLLHAQAMEEVLQYYQAPEILHLATHGFFLSDRQMERLTGAQPIFSAWQTTATANKDLEEAAFNPLVRSGLALAGANRAKGSAATGQADGLLTAEKVLNLNLHGTRLVVLSACNTGVGEVKSGEGVYGLRRAFIQAGAQGIVMSMWPVPDRETKEMMVAFYKNMKDGQNSPKALRQAVLHEMSLVRERYGTAHPGLWGAFVFLGKP
jgi:tetratricopeptide (TPR) repeat protein/CHAT domain-containing protein